VNGGFGQRPEHVGHFHILVDGPAHPNVMLHDFDALGRFDTCGKGPGVEIAPQAAEIKHHIPGFHEFPHGRVHDSAVVHADVARRGLVQSGFVHEHGGVGQAPGADEFLGLGHESQAMEQVARQDDTGFGLGQFFGDGSHGVGQGIGVTRDGFLGDYSATAGFGHGMIGRDGDVDRTMAINGLMDDAFGFRNDIFRRENGAGAHGRLRHLGELVDTAVPKRMVYDAPLLQNLAVGHAHEVKDGEMFGIGTGHAAQGRKFAHPVGGAQRRHAFHPGIAIGGVSRIEFVATADPAHVRVGRDGIV